MLTIDRRDIINYDLSMFDDTARSLGRSAMRSLSDLVYMVLLANGGNFFSSANGNYDEGADTALSIESLSEGIARMIAQRDDENRDLDIKPQTLLVAPELHHPTKQMLMCDYIQRANNDLPTGNALKNIVSLEVEPQLSNSQRFPPPEVTGVSS
jgi:phage major head subunit gpT-like protein